MKRYFVSHTDLDGLYCIALLKHFYNCDLSNDDDFHCAVTVDYKGVNYEVQNILKNMNECDMLYITDIFVNEETAELIQQAIDDGNGSYVLLDHHSTATWLNKYDWATVKLRYSNGVLHSGASLLTEYLYGQTADDVVYYLTTLVRMYDTWAWKKASEEWSHASKQLQELFTVLDAKSFITKIMYALSDSDREEAWNTLFDYDSIQKIEEYRKSEDVKYFRALNALKYFNIDGNTTAWYINANSDSNSVTMDRILKEKRDIDWICCINLIRNTLEFRTIRDDIDLAKDIAAKFGGGGHPHAAGSPLPDNFQYDIISNIISTQFKI